jgi:hypothetical protein
MCVPALAAAAGAASTSTILTAATTAIGAFGAYQGAQAQKAQYNAQAAQSDAAARNSDDQARRAQERGDAEMRKQGAAQSDLRGKQRAALAANGLDLSYGSAAATLDQTDYYGLQDRETLTRNMDDEDYGFRQDAANKRSNASFARSSAKATSPWLAAGTTLLSGGAKVAEKWRIDTKEA